MNPRCESSHGDRGVDPFDSATISQEQSLSPSEEEERAFPPLLAPAGAVCHAPLPTGMDTQQLGPVFHKASGVHHDHRQLKGKKVLLPLQVHFLNG